VIAPEIAEAAEGKRLDAQDKAARKNQYLRIRDDGDGTTSISGKLPAADGEALRTVIEAIANSAKAAEPDTAWAEGQPSYEARRAQAMMTLVHSYQAGGEGPRNGGDRPRVTVVMNWEDLLRGVRGATLLGSNSRISAAEARVLACDADILPAVMGSNSQLLDLGRTTRLLAGDLRQAIALRDRGCVFPGCPANRAIATPTTSNPGHSAVPRASTMLPSSVRRITASSNPIHTPTEPPNTNAGTCAWEKTAYPRSSHRPSATNTDKPNATNDSSHPSGGDRPSFGDHPAG
jgi:hypothetical protein